LNLDNLWFNLSVVGPMNPQLYLMKGIKLPLLALFSLLISTGIYAQSSKTEEADHAFETEHIYEAIDLYKKAYTSENKKSEKIRIIYMIGECYRLTYNFEMAESWYLKAEKAKYGETDPDLYLNLAAALRVQGKFEEAIERYEKYNQLKPGVKRAQDGLEGCKLAKKWMDKPTPHIIENVSALNSKQYDYAPEIVGRRKDEVIFVSARPGGTGNGIDTRSGENYTDLFMSEQDRKGKWSVPKPLIQPINTEFNEGPVTVTKRDKEMFYTHCPVEEKATKPCELWKAIKRGQDWAEPVKVEIVADSFSIGHPTISADDNTLFFASDLEGGKGGKDIWMVTYDQKKNTYGEPVNVPGINTPGDELFPFIKDDGTLYFASNGYPGMGGLDIYKAEKTGKAEWGNVENLKFPINSEANDFGIFYLGNKDQGYFSSDRKGGKGGADIYSFKLPPVIYTLQGTVKDVDCKDPIAGATVKLIGTDGSSVETLTDAQGFYKFEEKENGDRYILENTSYTILVEKNVGAKKASPKCDQSDYDKRKYLNGKGQETTVGVEKSTAFVHDFELQCSNCGEIKFKTVLYPLGSAELLVDDKVNSKDSLDFLYQTLIDNPNIVIELAAHTDARGSDASNQKLSDERAQTCVDYLISKGIDSERLVPKGYGESSPYVDKNTGIEYNESYINSLPTKQEREAAHQLNRRTVFQVLRDDYEPKPSEGIEGENPNDSEGGDQ
jgi:peptidoglycan-associated lipoprotein